MTSKGIILAGGNGTRLLPLTTVTSKQLLPIYDKPMIYYPLTTLMLAGIRDILVITKPEDEAVFARVLGGKWGIKIRYMVQHRPRGIPEAFLIGERFMDGQDCALILGDNIFYGAGFGDVLKKTSAPTIFCHWVKDPERYGVLDDGKIIEKPNKPKSNWAVTGLYFYDNRVVDIVRGLVPSKRGELEITDVNNAYIKLGLNVQKLGRGYAWFDAGTYDSLLQVSQFIQTIQERQGLKIGDPQEIARHMGFI